MEFLDYLMKELKSKKMEDVVLSFSENDVRQIKFADNKIVNITVESLNDISVFVVKDKKILTTNFKESLGDVAISGDLNIMQRKNIDKFVNRLIIFLKAIKPKEDYMGINDKKFNYKEVVDGYDSKVKNVDDVDLVYKGINAAFKEGAKRTNGIFETHDTKSTTLTSAGVEFNEKRSELYFSIRSFIAKEESGHMNSSSRILSKFSVENAGKESGRIAKESKNPIKGQRGKFDVIFFPMAFAPLLDNIGESASIFSVESGLSFFNNKIGKKIGSDIVNIYDDATLRNGIGSGKADSEGVIAQRTPLIENGIYRKYLHNTSTARKYRTESTGNAGLISPDPWNIVLDKGDMGLDEMIKNVKKGILVTNVWYTRFVNYHTGDFSTIPRDGAFLIENGKIKQSLKGIRISDNVLKILKNIDGIGNNPVILRTWEAELPVYTPHVLVRDCKITTPTV